MNQWTINNCDLYLRQVKAFKYIQYHNLISYENYYYLNWFGYEVLDK